jgi:hypothetical protein
MSRISKTLLIASVFLFLMSHVADKLRVKYQIPVEARAAWMEPPDYDPGYDDWDIIVFVAFASSFACVFCAILLWKRDRPRKYQRLFLE